MKQILILLLWVISVSNSVYCQPLSPQTQAAYQGILKVAREAMGTPAITREQFEKKISIIVPGNDDDQKAAKGGAMAMFDSVEQFHSINRAESKFDYSKIFDGSRYRAKEDLLQIQSQLSNVNQILLATIKAGNNSIKRLEEELRKAKVSEERIKLEINAARKNESETKAQIDKGWQKMQAKIELNESRIIALEFLTKTFGSWRFENNFYFSSTAEQDEFTRLMKIISKEQAASES